MTILDDLLSKKKVLTREDYKAMSDIDIMQPYMDLVPGGVLRKVVEKQKLRGNEGQPRHPDGVYEYIFDHAGLQWRMHVPFECGGIYVEDLEGKDIDEDFFYGKGLSDDGSTMSFLRNLEWSIEYSEGKESNIHKARSWQYRCNSFQRGIHDICEKFDYNYFDIQDYDGEDSFARDADGNYDPFMVDAFDYLGGTGTFKRITKYIGHEDFVPAGIEAEFEVEVGGEGLIELSPNCIEELERVVYEYAKAEFSEKETDEKLKAVSLEAVPHLIHKQTVRRIVRLLKGDKMW